MGWAVFNGCVWIEFYFLEGDPDSPRGGITGGRYLALLEERLGTVLTDDDIYMQGNASIHRSRICSVLVGRYGY